MTRYVVEQMMARRKGWTTRRFESGLGYAVRWFAPDGTEHNHPPPITDEEYYAFHDDHPTMAICTISKDNKLMQDVFRQLPEGLRQLAELITPETQADLGKTTDLIIDMTPPKQIEDKDANGQ